MAITMSEEADDFSKWERPVGRFILCFGEIELFTIYLWRELFGALEIPKQLRDRNRKMIGELKKRNMSESLVNSLIECNRLSERRNLVAHNPTKIHIFENTQTREIVKVETAVSSPLSDYYLDLDGMFSLAEEARVLRSKLSSQVLALGRGEVVT